MSKLVNNWITSEVMASNRNPELNEPGPSPKKKVYPNVRLSQMPGGLSPKEQEDHNPAVSPDKAKEPEIWDSEERAQKLLAYAIEIKKERNCDFFKAWILASEAHPELIGSSDGMSKTAKVPETNVLPDSGANAVSASYTEIGFIK